MFRDFGCHFFGPVKLSNFHFFCPQWGLALLGVRVGPAFLGFGFWPFLLGVRVGPPFLGPSVFLMVVVASSFLLWGFALPLWSGVGPSFLKVAPLVLRRGGWPFLPGVRVLALPYPLVLRDGGWPFLLSLSGGWKFLERGLARGPAFWECGHWPFCLRVRGSPFLLGVGPPFSGPSVFLMVVVASSFLLWEFVPSFWSGVGPSFLVWGVHDSVFVWGLAFLGLGPGGDGWTCLLGVFGHSFLVGCWLSGLGLACPSFWEVALLSSVVGVGPSFSGLGFGSCPSFFGGGLPFLLGLSALLGGWPFGMKVGPAFSGWELVSFSGWESAFPSHGWGLACPSRDGGLALPSRGVGWPFLLGFGPSFMGPRVWPVLLVLGL